MLPMPPQNVCSWLLADIKTEGILRPLYPPKRTLGKPHSSSPFSSRRVPQSLLTFPQNYDFIPYILSVVGIIIMFSENYLLSLPASAEKPGARGLRNPEMMRNDDIFAAEWKMNSAKSIGCVLLGAKK